MQQQEEAVTLESVVARLDELHAQTHAVGAQIKSAQAQQAGVLNRLSGEGGGVDCSEEAEHRFAALKNELNEILECVHDSSDDNNILSSNKAGASDKVQAEIRHLEGLIPSLERLCEINKRFGDVDAHVSAGRFSAAAEALREMDSLAESFAVVANNDDSGDVVEKNGGGGQEAPVVDEGEEDAAVLDAQAARAVRRECRRRRVTLKCRLEDALASAVTIQPGAAAAGSTDTLQIRKQLQLDDGTGVALGEIFSALVATASIDASMRPLACTLRTALQGLLTEEVVPPCEKNIEANHYEAAMRFKPPAAVASHHPGDGDDDNVGAARGDIDIAADAAEDWPASAHGTVVPLPLVFERLLQALAFIHEQILGCDPLLAASLGKWLWHGASSAAATDAASASTSSASQPPDNFLGNAKVGGGGLLPLLLRRLWRAIPNQASELPALDELAAAAAAFERQVSVMGFVSEEGQGAMPMGQFRENASAHLAHKRRCALLARGRSIMLQNMHSSRRVTEREEDDGATAAGGSKDGNEGGGDKAAGRVFFFPACQVTESAHEAVQLVHEIMVEACATAADRPAAANALYRTARDMISLFRAVVPTAHAEAIATVPLLSALHHNDCLYFAHHCMTIGHRYRPRLPPPLGRSVTMVDMVPLLRESGERVLAAQLAVQRDQCLELAQATSSRLLEVNDDCRHDGNGGSGAGAGASGDPVDAGINRVVHHLGQLATAWRGVLPGSVYERCMGNLLDAVLDMFCRTVQGYPDIGESASHQIHSLFSRLLETKHLLAATPDGADQRSGGFAHVPSWRKFRMLTALMDYALYDIVEQLHLGVFVDFRADELAALIRALFTDSERRAKAIAEVYQQLSS